MAAGAAVELEGEKEHGAERGGDQHHADRDENGADTDASPILDDPAGAGCLIRAAGYPNVPETRRSAQQRTPAMVTAARPYSQELGRHGTEAGSSPASPAWVDRAPPGRAFAAFLALHAAVWTAAAGAALPQSAARSDRSADVRARMAARLRQAAAAAVVAGRDRLPRWSGTTLPITCWRRSRSSPRFALVFLTARPLVGGARRAGRGADRRRPALLQLHRRQVQPRRHPAAVLGARRLRLPSRAARRGERRTGCCSASPSGCRCGRNISSSCWWRRWRVFLLVDRDARKALATPGPYVAAAVALDRRWRRIWSGWCRTTFCPSPMPSTAPCCRAAGTTTSGTRCNSPSASCSSCCRRW